MRGSMLPRFLLPTKPKKEPGVDAEEYNIISYEWKITANKKLEKRLYVEESNKKIFVIFVEQ